MIFLVFLKVLVLVVVFLNPAYFLKTIAKLLRKRNYFVVFSIFLRYFLLYARRRPINRFTLGSKEEVEKKKSIY